MAHSIQSSSSPVAKQQQQQQQGNCNDKYCVDFAEYPKNYIQALNLEKFEHLFGSDIDDSFALRFDADETGLCESRRTVIYPQRGMTSQGTWLTIINNDDGKLVQGVLVEQCT